jgi:death-on-curing protein
LRNEPRWLPIEEAFKINRDAVGITGEPYLVLNRPLLESAWARPVNHWQYGEDDVLILAVQLLFGVARNHAFQQGNKRTGFTAAVMFLHDNGYRLTATDSSELGELVRRTVADEITETRFIEIIRPLVVPI